jgi:hypothetical protein
VVTSGQLVLHDDNLSFILELVSKNDKHYHQLVCFSVPTPSPPPNVHELEPTRLFEANPCPRGLGLHIFPDTSRGLYATVEIKSPGSVLRSFGQLTTQSGANDKLSMTIIADGFNSQPSVSARRIASDERYEMVLMPSSPTPTLQMIRFDPADGSCTTHDLEIPADIVPNLTFHTSSETAHLSGRYHVDFRLGIVVLSLDNQRVAILSYL